MRIVPADERLEGFGVCFLCEQYISVVDGQNIAIKTDYEFDPDFQTNLTGPKYCCGSCARTLASTIDWVSPDSVKALKVRTALAEENLNGLLESVKNLKTAAVR